MMEKTVAFHTLGCKLNYAETSAIARTFKNRGYTEVESTEPADIYVINTCSVTENADKECRFLVRNVLSKTPSAFIAIIGCYAQLKPEEIGSIEGVDLVLGADEKFNLVNYLENHLKKKVAEIHSCEISQINTFDGAWSQDNRTRSFLKIQDGCDYTCSYCTIPFARGASRSDSINNVIRNAEVLSGNGVKEIVLTGVNIGDFDGFYDLISRLDQIIEIERFRISSIEPNLLTDEIIEFVASSKRFVPHFHIPLQSGSNKVLKLMKRRYLRELYASRVEKIRSLMPLCSIGADVITGFPGETEQDFNETYSFLNQLDVSYLHVFTYSERPGTEAIDFDCQVPIHERRNRNKMLRILSEKKQKKFYRLNLETVPIRNVLFEQESKNGMMYGFTENYIKVKTNFNPKLVNNLTPVRFTNIGTDGIMEVEMEKNSHLNGNYSFV